ncbi:unnamed protein product, partial [Effrenium voratum]
CHTHALFFFAMARVQSVLRLARVLQGSPLSRAPVRLWQPRAPSVMARMSTGRGDVDGGTTVSETEFHAQADKSLQRLHDCLDAHDLDCIDDLGFEDGVLNIKLESGKAYVINKHFSTRQ